MRSKVLSVVKQARIFLCYLKVRINARVVAKKWRVDLYR